MRQGLGAYALGVALTGKTAQQINEDIHIELKIERELFDKLREKTNVPHGILIREFDKVYNPRIFKTRIKFLEHLLSARPRYLKLRLNLKDHQYNPEDE
jgi:hypothetical protein